MILKDYEYHNMTIQFERVNDTSSSWRKSVPSLIAGLEFVQVIVLA